MSIYDSVNMSDGETTHNRPRHQIARDEAIEKIALIAMQAAITHGGLPDDPADFARRVYALGAAMVRDREYAGRGMRPPPVPSRARGDDAECRR